MKIFFSPSYTTNTYLDLDALPGGIAIDTSVCDISSLVNLIELHSGIYHPDMGEYESQVEYMRALKKMDEDHPDNVLHNSLAIDAISTAKICLDWREKLILSGWTSSITPSKRLQAIADAEVYFDLYTLADRIMQLPDIIKKSDVAKDIHLIMPYDYKLMHPAIGAIVEVLKDNGAKVKIMPDTAIPHDSNLAKLGKWYNGEGDINGITEPDDTVEVIEFENREKVVEWLATLDKSDNEVWISDHCADIDRAMVASDKPTCGSMADAGLPATVQIAMLAISQFMNPIDINKLVAWLRQPRSPLPKVRYKIAYNLLKEGGYNESGLDEWINEYIAKHPDENKEDIKKKLKKYLHKSNGKEADKKEFKKFFESILEWAESECATIYAAELRAQFNELISRLKAILLLVDMHPTDTIDNSTLEKWMMMCGDAYTYPQYAAEAGAHYIISNPGNIIGEAGHVIWCSFSNFTPQPLAYDFLSQSEIDALKSQGCNIYDADVETKAIRIEQQWPLHHCKHLTIIEMAEKNKDEVRGIMSQQLRSIPKAVWEVLKKDKPTVDAKEYDIDLTSNFISGSPNKIEIENGAVIKFKETESYTSLSELIFRPAQYLLKYALNIRDNNTTIYLAQGNVAHYVIECIFLPGRDVDDIRENLDADFEKHFEEGLKHKGMLLLLPENKVELIKIKNGLRKSIVSLIDIIDKNHLKIISCEEKCTVEQFLSPDTAIDAKFDMRLQRTDGVLVIFDLKWTTDANKHRDLLEDERAMQLDIYTTVLSAETKSQDIICGYFVMPYAKLFTYHNFKGDNVLIIKRNHSYIDAFEMIRNSYTYRLNELQSGIIEMSHGLKVSKLQYTLDTGEKRLYKMADDDKKYFDYKSLLN